jgi:hypothetical protein
MRPCRIRYSTNYYKHKKKKIKKDKYGHDIGMQSTRRRAVDPIMTVKELSAVDVSSYEQLADEQVGSGTGISLCLTIE